MTQHRATFAHRVRASFRKSPLDARKKLALWILPELMKQLWAAIKRHEPWAIALGFNLCEMAQAGPAMVAVFQRLGFDNEEQAQKSAHILKSIESAPEHERLESMARRLEGAGYTVTRPNTPHLNGSSAEEVT